MIFFLTIELESRAPSQKKGQEATSHESSPMAKPRAAIPSKARPINLVMRSPRSEQNSSQDSGYPVNPGNADEKKEAEIALGNSWRSASRSQVRCYQASRQENAPVAPRNSWREEQLQRQSDEREYSGSNCRRKLVLGASKSEFQNIRYTNPSIHDQDFTVLAKEVGNVSRILNFLDASIQKQMC